MGALFSVLCYNNEMQNPGGFNIEQKKLWYRNPWIIAGFLLLGIIFFGLFLFVGKTWSYYQAIKQGQDIEQEFMPLSQPTAQMQLEEKMKEKQKKLFRDLVKGDENDPFFGPENAEKEIVYFGDYGCPYCKMAAGTIQNLLRMAPEVKITMRDFPIVELHPDSMLAAQAARCVWRQGDPAKYLLFINTLYSRQDDHSVQALDRYAVEAGVENLSYSICMEQKSVLRNIEVSIQDAEKAGVTATPTFFIDGMKVEGVHDADKLLKLLE